MNQYKNLLVTVYRAVGHRRRVGERVPVSDSLILRPVAHPGRLRFPLIVLCVGTMIHDRRAAPNGTGPEESGQGQLSPERMMGDASRGGSLADVAVWLSWSSCSPPLRAHVWPISPRTSPIVV